LVLDHGGAPLRSGPLGFEKPIQGAATDNELAPGGEGASQDALVRDKHVVTAQQQRTIQPDIRHGRQAVETENELRVWLAAHGRQAQPIPPVLGVESARWRIEAPLAGGP
jgi:hypothetical protein